MAAVESLASQIRSEVQKLYPHIVRIPSSTKIRVVSEIAQVNEEAQKLINGSAYDEDVIGSPNPETRQLVGQSCWQQIVGRNATRREHARLLL